ncbi:hypothetical protein DPMN_004994 [Dreissena polymorpha]|uniref:Ig-like domain-containing protein n=2 Tax=Dreissena polymorpha TaxID=45954 RepID=A0A9D4RW33_DREPO|nr:hypothetical protein DPMN_004994 [Dreissena polymorpha]
MSLTYHPLKHIVEGNSLTLKCSGGRDIMWYYYLSNGLIAVDVTNASLLQETHQQQCNRTIWISTLTLTLTKQMNLFRVRCTTRAFIPNDEDRRGFMETPQIHVLYKPTEVTITIKPDNVLIEEGSVNLKLKCHADGSPRPSYQWLFQPLDRRFGLTILKNKIFVRGKDIQLTKRNLCDSFTYNSQYIHRSNNWIFDSNSIIGTNHDMVLRDLTANQTGIYTCLAYNRINHLCHGVTGSVGIVVGPRAQQIGQATQAHTTTATILRNDLIVIICLTLGMTLIALIVVLAACRRRPLATTASFNKKIDVEIQTDVGTSENNSPKRVYKCLDGQISVEEAYDVEWMTL